MMPLSRQLPKQKKCGCHGLKDLFHPNRFLWAEFSICLPIILFTPIAITNHTEVVLFLQHIFMTMQHPNSLPSRHHNSLLGALVCPVYHLTMIMLLLVTSKTKTKGSDLGSETLIEVEVTSPQETKEHTDNRVGAIAHVHKQKMMMMANGSSEAHVWSVLFGNEKYHFSQWLSLRFHASKAQN